MCPLCETVILQGKEKFQLHYVWISRCYCVLRDCCQTVAGKWPFRRTDGDKQAQEKMDNFQNLDELNHELNFSQNSGNII